MATYRSYLAPTGPHPIDIHVGDRVRSRRRMLDINQSELAKALGLTFQQIQKYEHGTNRISASKLFEISCFLKVPIGYFYEGLEGGFEDGQSNLDADRALQTYLTETEGLALVRSFPRLSQRTRRRILDLVKDLADDLAEEETGASR